MIPSLICAVFLSVFTVMTILFYDALLNWWDVFFAVEENFSTVPLPLPPSQAQMINSRPSVVEVLKLPPKMLVRLSSTYFLPAKPVKNLKRRAVSAICPEKNWRLIDHKRAVSGMPAIQVKEEFKVDRCKICCLNNSNAVVMQCGHGGICFECAVKMWETSRKCHMCRGPISKLLKIELEDQPTVPIQGVNSSVNQ